MNKAYDLPGPGNLFQDNDLRVNRYPLLPIADVFNIIRILQKKEDAMIDNDFCLMYNYLQCLHMISHSDTQEIAKCQVFSSNNLTSIMNFW